MKPGTKKTLATIWKYFVVSIVCLLLIAPVVMSVVLKALGDGLKWTGEVIEHLIFKTLSE